MVEFLIKNNLISDNTLGLEPGHLYIYQHLFSPIRFINLLMKPKITVIFHDISKAFDKVCQISFIWNSNQRSILSNIGNTIINFGSLKKTRFFLNGKHCSWNSSGTIALQSSIFEPILLFMYINSISCDMLTKWYLLMIFHFCLLYVTLTHLSVVWILI